MYACTQDEMYLQTDDLLSLAFLIGCTYLLFHVFASCVNTPTAETIVISGTPVASSVKSGEESV